LRSYKKHFDSYDKGSSNSECSFSNGRSSSKLLGKSHLYYTEDSYKRFSEFSSIEIYFSSSLSNSITHQSSES